MRPKYEKCLSQASYFFENITEKRIQQTLSENKPSEESELSSICSHSSVSEAFDNNYDHDLCPHDVIDLDLVIEEKSTDTQIGAIIEASKNEFQVRALRS